MWLYITNKIPPTFAITFLTQLCLLPFFQANKLIIFTSILICEKFKHLKDNTKNKINVLRFVFINLMKCYLIHNLVMEEKKKEKKKTIVLHLTATNSICGAT